MNLRKQSSWATTVHVSAVSHLRGVAAAVLNKTLSAVGNCVQGCLPATDAFLTSLRLCHVMQGTA